MAVWFSASAVAPALAAEFHLSNFAQAALTSGVQAGLRDRLPRERVSRASRSRRSAATVRRVRRDRRASPTRVCSSSIPASVAAPAAARGHRHLHGRRLSGRHEARGDLGARRHGTDGRHPRRRADAGLGRRRTCSMPSAASTGGRRVALSSASALAAALGIALAGLGPNRKPAPPLRTRTRC